NADGGISSLHLRDAGLTRAEHLAQFLLCQATTYPFGPHGSCQVKFQLNECFLFISEPEKLAHPAYAPACSFLSLSLLLLHFCLPVRVRSSYALSRFWLIVITSGGVFFVFLLNTSAIMMASGSIR